MVTKKSVVILVCNDKKEIALQMRSMQDESYPGHWDFSAAGGVKFGEYEDVAAKRELEEEIGVKSNPKFVEKILYKDATSIDELYVYMLMYSGNFLPDMIEVSEVKFFSLAAIENLISSSAKLHPELRFFWEEGIIHKYLNF